MIESPAFNYQVAAQSHWPSLASLTGQRNGADVLPFNRLYEVSVSADFTYQKPSEPPGSCRHDAD